jgi:SAM-dependent methyltransferase
VLQLGSPQRRVIDYYRRLESRVPYALLLGGTRHFGWYPPGAERLPMRAALRLMEDRLGGALDLPAGALVLDAGCGRGAVALRLAPPSGCGSRASTSWRATSAARPATPPARAARAAPASR